MPRKYCYCAMFQEKKKSTGEFRLSKRHIFVKDCGDLRLKILSLYFELLQKALKYLMNAMVVLFRNYID